jgi:hypothetical protein
VNIIKNNFSKSLISTMLALIIVVGCFAILPQTTRAAGNTYVFIGSTNGSTNTITYGDDTQTTAPSALMRLQNTETGEIIYALCVNQKILTYTGVEYELVELKDYNDLNPEQKSQILAVLNYVSIKYGLDTPTGIALAQTVIWRIIHPDIKTITPSTSVTIKQEDIEEVFSHRADLAIQYDVDVSIQGTVNKIAEDANYAYYGPFSISENYALSEINFDLTFTAGTDAIFTNPTYTTIQQTKPGETFYVGVPINTKQTTVSFEATATNAVNRITGIKFLVSKSGTNQPLVIYQPLVQPLTSPNTERYTYSCNYSFTLKPVERVLGPAYGSVTATNAGNQNAILAGLNPKNGNPYYNDKNNPNTPYVVPNSNHFVYAILDRAELESPQGVKLDMLVGNKFTIVGTATVRLVDDNLEITIDGKGTFGATAFNQLPVFNNGNIHSQKPADLAKFGATTGFSHNNQATLPCPSGNTIYLYIHCDTIQFYQ